MQASSLEHLRVKLEKEGFSNISYVVVNHQGAPSRLLYMHLKDSVSEHIPVYQQEENQKDVWTLLNGNKDDFLIYDRCGRLVYHLGLPYSILSFSYVEEAIKIAYCEEKCGNCSVTTLEDKDFCKNVSLVTARNTTEAPEPRHQHEHGHGHQHEHGHEHQHGHRHGHGHEHRHGHGHVRHGQQPEAPSTHEHHPHLGLHDHHKLQGPQRQGQPVN